MNPTVTDYDRAYMRELRISTEPDLRTREQSEERVTIPEWIRRAQWRHFWEDQDAAYELVEPGCLCEGEVAKGREGPTPLHAPRLRMSKPELKNALSRTPNRVTRLVMQ
jgi:hypothetical protein